MDYEHIIDSNKLPIPEQVDLKDQLALANNIIEKAHLWRGKCWSPITNAPKDGSNILGCDANNGELFICYWYSDRWVSIINYYPLSPTYYIPIPPLPSNPS